MLSFLNLCHKYIAEACYYVREVISLQCIFLGGIVNDSLRPQIPSWCDPEWKGLMESCWSSDPAERPSFTDISQRLRKMAAAMNVK